MKKIEGEQSEEISKKIHEVEILWACDENYVGRSVMSIDVQGKVREDVVGQ